MEVRRMICMSTALYEETKNAISEAYCNQDKTKIEKETSFIFNQLFVTMLSSFTDRLIGIHLKPLDYKNDYFLTAKNRENLSEWLNRFHSMELPLTNLEFGKLKVDFEDWYYQLGGEEMEFLYREDYLLKPKQASKQLGISTVTLNKYIKHGLECVDTTSHHKIPKHAVDIWKDPVYSIKTQMVFQAKIHQKQTTQERIQEINQELLEFQIKFKAMNCLEAFKNINIHSLDDPSPYYEWRDLEEEKEILVSKLIEETKAGGK